VLSIKLEATWLVYAAVLLTGIFVFSAQVLVYAFVGHLYPPAVRGTALGMAAGVGRVGAIVGPSITGAIVIAGIAPTRGLLRLRDRGRAGDGRARHRPRRRPGSGGWKMTEWPATPPPLGQASPRAPWHSSARSTRSTDGSR